jgi:hypothetical protein
METLEKLDGLVSFYLFSGRMMQSDACIGLTHYIFTFFSGTFQGINEIVSTVQTNEILSSVAKMNEWYLNNADPDERQYTMWYVNTDNEK